VSELRLTNAVFAHRMRWLWHVLRTNHRVGFQEATWAGHCDCGRRFWPLGRKRTKVIPLGRWEFVWTHGGRP